MREVRVTRNAGRCERTPLAARVDIVWRDVHDADLIRRAAAAEVAQIAALNDDGAVVPSRPEQQRARHRCRRRGQAPMGPPRRLPRP